MSGTNTSGHTTAHTTAHTSGIGLTFINANLGGEDTSLRIVGSRIASLGELPQPDDLVIDLGGDRLLPGLINAHDHLQHNHFSGLRYRAHYTNVREWIEDVSSRMQTSTALRNSGDLPREHRLLHGAAKNILSGVTTVAHHDPLYELLATEAYPISVVRHYGWSHSLFIDGEDTVRRAYQQTPIAWPWIIHASEGLDSDAAGEFGRLDALGCVGPNTLIVHGIALGRVQRERLVQAGAGLIWCPASNLYLYGGTADVRDLVREGCVALGTDSRMSGSRDLLSELGLAREVGEFDEPTLEAMVTTDSARLLRLTDRGELRPGAVADILVIPSMPLSEASRADVCLVMSRGRMLYADTDYAAAFASASAQVWVEVTVDGRTKAMDRKLATLLANLKVQEPGLDIGHTNAWRAA